MMELPNGPYYPDLGPKVKALRKSGDRYTHGMAVLEAIRSKQTQELRRELPSHNVPCASGTNYNKGRDILKAVAKRHRGLSIAYADRVRRERTEEKWRDMYCEAMKEKWKADIKRRVLQVAE